MERSLDALFLNLYYILGLPQVAAVWCGVVTSPGCCAVSREDGEVKGELCECRHVFSFIHLCDATIVLPSCVPANTLFHYSAQCIVRGHSAHASQNSPRNVETGRKK